MDWGRSPDSMSFLGFIFLLLYPQLDSKKPEFQNCAPGVDSFSQFSLSLCSKDGKGGHLQDRESVIFLSWPCLQVRSSSKAAVWWERQQLGRNLKLWASGILFDQRNCATKGTESSLLSFLYTPSHYLPSETDQVSGRACWSGNAEVMPIEPEYQEGDSGAGEGGGA